MLEEYKNAIYVILCMITVIIICFSTINYLVLTSIHNVQLSKSILIPTNEKERFIDLLNLIFRL